MVAKADPRRCGELAQLGRSRGETAVGLKTKPPRVVHGPVHQLPCELEGHLDTCPLEGLEVPLQERAVRPRSIVRGPMTSLTPRQ